MSKPLSGVPKPPRLLNISENSKREIIPLGKAMLLIGRGGANLDFEDDTISHNHASVVNIDGKFHLRDNGSVNGSYVNGKRIKLQELKHQDIIRFGTYQFLVDLGAEGDCVEAAHNRTHYPLITIPASHKAERYKLSYKLKNPKDPSQDALTIVTTGYLEGQFSQSPKSEKCSSCGITTQSNFVFCPSCGAKLIS